MAVQALKTLSNISRNRCLKTLNFCHCWLNHNWKMGIRVLLKLLQGEALKIAPDSMDMLMFLGKQQVKKGQLDQAIHSFSQVIKLHPDYIEAYFLLGEVYEKQREYAESN